MSTHRLEDTVQNGEHLEAGREFLAISVQTNATGDEGLLRVESTGGHGNRGVPVLLESNVLGLGRTSTERGATVANLQVVDHGSLRAIGDHLGESQPVPSGQFAHSAVGRHGGAESVDPLEAEVPDTIVRHRCLVCQPMNGFPAADERRHDASNSEEWTFSFWNPALAGHVLVTRRADGLFDYAWGLWRRERPLLHVTETDIRSRGDGLLLKAPGLWAELVCDDPFGQWTVGNETHAVELDGADEALGRAYGVAVPIASDLEWYAVSGPEAIVDGYRQNGVVHGVIETDDGELTLSEVAASRGHRWGGGGWCGTDSDDVAVAHLGARLAFRLSGERSVDVALSPAGWRRRESGSTTSWR